MSLKLVSVWGDKGIVSLTYGLDVRVGRIIAVIVIICWARSQKCSLIPIEDIRDSNADVLKSFLRLLPY
jgi:hypothetical protein